MANLKPFIAAVVGRSAPLGFLWGVAEGSVFFVVPDVAVSFVALFSIRRCLSCSLAAALGAAVAGAGLYLTATLRPDAAFAIVHAVPFVTARMLSSAPLDWDHYGLWALFKGAVSGVPYKVYAISAPQRSGFLAFALATIPARLFRFVAVGLGAAFAARALPRRLRDDPTRLVAVHAACWSVFYACYWIGVSA
jgi:hypothetical protein